MITFLALQIVSFLLSEYDDKEFYILDILETNFLGHKLKVQFIMSCCVGDKLSLSHFTPALPCQILSHIIFILILFACSRQRIVVSQEGLPSTSSARSLQEIPVIHYILPTFLIYNFPMRIFLKKTFIFFSKHLLSPRLPAAGKQSATSEHFFYFRFFNQTSEIFTLSLQSILRSLTFFFFNVIQ